MSAPGRGAAFNPGNRFELLQYKADPDADVDPDDRPLPTTQFYRDATRSILASNDSPDVGFDTSINPYRGCEHGCIYCYARPYHEYLGMSAGLDFESKIMVKENAAALLRRELMSRKWEPKILGISGVTDPYQPIERKLLITRGCLEVLAEFRNPVGLVTKNKLITRDIDILSDLARHAAAAAHISITTLDPTLAGQLEPRASRPAARLEAVAELSEAGVPVGVLVAPIIPGLNDHEVPAILAAAHKAGARSAGYTILRLPHAVGDLFADWLERFYPERKEKVLGRIRDAHAGQLNDARFGARMRGDGPLAQAIGAMFKATKHRLGMTERPRLSTAAFRRPGETEMRLFERDVGSG